MVATAHLARSAWILAESARLLGRDDEAEKYGLLAQEVRSAFARAFVTPSGRIFSDAQTVYALAIEWDLLPEAHQREEAGRRLADLVRTAGFRIATGFVGTPLVCDALTNTGHVDVAYRLLLQTECPSWLYPVTMGATTIWERWDSLRPDGSVNPGGMTSFNHYALGAVADWLHRRVAGLAPAAPGYRSLTVHPLPTEELTRASARHLTPYGEASVAWERSGGRLRLEVHVPVGAAADGTCARNAGHGAASATVTTGGTSPTRSPAEREHRPDWSRSTVRDLLDDPVSWDQRGQRGHSRPASPDDDTQAARMLTSYLDTPATQVAQALAPDDRFPGAQDLRDQIADDPGRAARRPRRLRGRIMTIIASGATTPIVPGFYPDPTICRVGDDYYLAHSSFEYFPGVPIWHSRDLLRWTQIGHVLTRRSQLARLERRGSSGLFAGTLRHHDGQFWYVTTNTSDFDAGQLLVWADDPGRAVERSGARSRGRTGSTRTSPGPTDSAISPGTPGRQLAVMMAGIFQASARCRDRPAARAGLPGLAGEWPGPPRRSAPLRGRTAAGISCSPKGEPSADTS